MGNTTDIYEAWDTLKHLWLGGNGWSYRHQCFPARCFTSDFMIYWSTQYSFMLAALFYGQMQAWRHSFFQPHKTAIIHAEHYFHHTANVTLEVMDLLIREAGIIVKDPQKLVDAANSHEVHNQRQYTVCISQQNWDKMQQFFHP